MSGGWQEADDNKSMNIDICSQHAIHDASFLCNDCYLELPTYLLRYVGKR